MCSPLMTQGFTGQWPHFKRETGDCIELLSFQINKYGNSFTVELSAIFPDHEYRNYPDTAALICRNVNKQLVKGFEWLNSFIKKHS